MEAPKTLRDKVLDMVRSYRLQEEFNKYASFQTAEIDWDYIDNGRPLSPAQQAAWDEVFKKE